MIMKVNKLFMLCSGLLLSGALLSCSSDDDSYTFDGYTENMAYLPLSAETPFNNTVTITPAGVIGNISEYKIGVNFQRTPAVDTKVTFALDQNLVAEYNALNGTEYVALPADMLSLTKATATVYADTLNSVDSVIVAVDNNRLAQLTEPKYMAAFKIVNVEGDRDMKISTSRSKFYAIINANIENLHLVDNDVQNFKVSITPVGVMGSCNFDQALRLKNGNLNNDATIKLVQDNSLLAMYNSETGDEAQALPAGLLNATNLTTSIEAGSNTSTSNIQMSVSEDDLKNLPIGVYVVPFKLTVTRSSDGATIEDGGRFYLRIPVSESGPVRDGGSQADLLGDEVGDDVKSTWTVISGTNINPDNYSDLFAGGWSASWNFSAERISSASFTLDTGEAGINLTAFNLSCYVLKSYTLQVSEDGMTWTDLPTEGNATIRDSYWNNWYALYGPFHCRYIRFNLTLDPDHFYWQYASWGYAGIMGIGIRAAE